MAATTARPSSCCAVAGLTSAFVVLAFFLTGCGLVMREATIAYIGINSHLTPKDVEIELGRSFIEAYKNLVTMHAALTVDKAMASPIPVSLDGDLHLAGRAPQAALPCWRSLFPMK
jgi:hypothetical protein